MRCKETSCIIKGQQWLLHSVPNNVSNISNRPARSKQTKRWTVCHTKHTLHCFSFIIQ